MAIALSQANFFRRFLLANPTANYEQACAAWTANSFPKVALPPIQNFYNASLSIRSKYGIPTLREVPTINGKVDGKALLGLLHRKNKNASPHQLVLWLSHDGINFTSEQIEAAISVKNMPKPLGNPKPVVVPKPVVAQKAKPAGYVEQYHKMEDDLDRLIAAAQKVENSSLVEEIRALRRKVIVAGAQLV